MRKEKLDELDIIGRMHEFLEKQKEREDEDENVFHTPQASRRPEPIQHDLPINETLIPPKLKDDSIVTKTYGNQVRQLFLQLVNWVPGFNYTLKEAQLVHEGEPVPGAFLPGLLLNMVRTSRTFRQQPNQPGVIEMLDILKDARFPAINIGNDDFKLLYTQHLRGELPIGPNQEAEFVSRPQHLSAKRIASESFRRTFSDSAADKKPKWTDWD
jgi:hypothetical protein